MEAAMCEMEMLREQDRQLHDLCQPLTTLQCQLELAQMTGDPESLKAAVDGGVDEALRMFAVIAQMREILEKVLGG